MASKYIALIVVLGVGILLLVIFGILAFVYQTKHQQLIAERKNYFSDYTTIKDNLGELIPLQLDLKLKDGEAVYAYEEKIEIYFNDLMKPKKVSRLYKKYQGPEQTEFPTKSIDDGEEEAEETRMGILRGTYSLKNFSHNADDPDFIGTILVTNQRVVFSNPQTNWSLHYNEISRIDPIMVMVEKTFAPGFSLGSQKGFFEIINHEIKTPIILQKLKEESEQDGIKS